METLSTQTLSLHEGTVFTRNSAVALIKFSDSLMQRLFNSLQHVYVNILLARHAIYPYSRAVLNPGWRLFKTSKKHLGIKHN